MAITDFVGGAAQGASNDLSQIQGVISGQTSSITTYLANLTGLNFLAPANSGPFQQPGNPKSALSGFAFDFYEDDDLELDIDVTDHWAEDNSVIQDHAAVGPLRATISGFVGEYVIPNPNAGLGGLINMLASKLQTVDAYLGKYTPGTAQAIAGKVTGAIDTAQDYVNEVSQYLQQAQNILSMFKPAGASRQQTALGTLLAAAQSRQTFTLTLPWKNVQNVMITNLQAKQTAETASKSELVVSVKQIRTVPISSAATPASVAANSQGRAAFQNQPVSALGTTQGTLTPTSNLITSFQSTSL